MNEARLVLKEQITNFSRTWLLAKYDIKSTYQTHYLGKAWEILNPLFQIIIYYFVFGIRLGGVTSLKAGTPYLIWLICGLISWLFLSSGITLGANCVYQKKALISRMAFPVSILPLLCVVTSLKKFIIMVGLFLPVLVLNGITPSFIGFSFYFIMACFFLNAVGLVFSTVTIFFRDFRNILATVMRLLFYVSGVTVEIRPNDGRTLSKLLSLNPLHFYIECFRGTLLKKMWLPENGYYIVFNLGIICFLFLMGAILQVQLKETFSDSF